MSQVEIAPARPGEVAAVVALLGRAGLPQDGVRQLVATLLVARANGGVVGSAAIEPYGREALLRSVAVDPSRRGAGLGRRLAEAAVVMASRLRVERLYLLTETAAPFFARLGFRPVSRADIPASVQASPEFAFLCPASAQAMMRDLRTTSPDPDPLMSSLNIADIPEREMVRGFRARFVHADAMTVAYWTIDAGAALPEHRHVHEQIVNVLEGEFELVVDGRPHRLGPGSVFVLPSGVPHGGRAISACRIVDVFHPVRDDYR